MTRGFALLLLIGSFLWALVQGGWVTAAWVLGLRGPLNPGVCHFDYGELPPTAVHLLAALLTLTPGTSSIDIVPHQRRLLLHVLNLADFERERAHLTARFVQPLRSLFGVADR